MVWCAAVGCNNNSFKKSRDKSITFFRLPKDDSLKKKWLNNLKRANLPKIENVRICHLHFEEYCFKRDLQVNCLYFLWFVFIMCKILALILFNLARASCLVSVFVSLSRASQRATEHSVARNQEWKMLILYNLKSRERMIRVSSMLRQYVFLKYVHPWKIKILTQLLKNINIW